MDKNYGALGPVGPSLFVCYARIGLGMPKETFVACQRWKEPCPGSRELKRRALDGENWRRALKKGGPRLEWKGRKDDERRWRRRIRKIPVGSEVANIVAIDPKMVAKVAELGANLLTKKDANISPSSH
ncbi:hypothetical protein TNCV_4775761 [Trichonephila clavipes]|nr:hypothetical protein TNCV_4775761 [Trichonephila clavipes]